MRKAAVAQDSSSIDNATAAAAALDPRPDEKPTSAPAQVWKPLAGGITDSPMEIISKAEGERPAVLNGKKASSLYGPPPEKLASSSSRLASSSSSSSSDPSSDSSSTASPGSGINGLGIPGGGASIEADNSGVCDRSCYNTVTPLTQNPNPKLGGLNLGAEGASSFSAFSQQPSAERDAWRSTFVTAEGRNFKVGNSTWFFGGTNQYSLTQTGKIRRRRKFFSSNTLVCVSFKSLSLSSLFLHHNFCHTHTKTRLVEGRPGRDGNEGACRSRRRVSFPLSFEREREKAEGTKMIELKTLLSLFL